MQAGLSGNRSDGNGARERPFRSHDYTRIVLLFKNHYQLCANEKTTVEVAGRCKPECLAMRSGEWKIESATPGLFVLVRSKSVSTVENFCNKLQEPLFIVNLYLNFSDFSVEL